MDGKNVAVYGRGTGATVAMEAAAVALSPQLFQCVALLSPITDWHAHGKTNTGQLGHAEARLLNRVYNLWSITSLKNALY